MRVLFKRKSDDDARSDITEIEVTVGEAKFEIAPSADETHLLVKTPKGVIRMQPVSVDRLAIEEVRP